MYKKSVILPLLKLSLAILIGESILKIAAFEANDEVVHNKQAVNMTLVWHWGDDQELQNITKEVKNNADISKVISSGIDNLLEASNTNSEAMAQMRLESNVIKNYLQNISLRLTALEDTLSLIRSKEVLRNSPESKSCAEIVQDGGADGVYTLYFDTEKVCNLRVYCKSDPDGGPAWTLIQRISSANFSTKRNWVEFENGFGDVGHDHWLGLKNILKLQKMLNGSMELWMYANRTDDSISNTKHSNFSIGSASTSYALKSLNYKEGGPESVNLRNSTGRKFTINYKHCNGAYYRDEGWWCDKDGDCCKGANSHYNNVLNTHMAIRPNSAK